MDTQVNEWIIIMNRFLLGWESNNIMTVIVTIKLKSDVSVVTLLMDFTRGQGLDSFDGILPKDDMINDIFMFITNSHICKLFLLFW